MMPKITLKWAQTIDGQLADDNNQSQWISGPEELKYTHHLRSRNDAVLVGAQTFLKDLCKLTVRGINYSGLQPCRVILDPKGRIFEALTSSKEVLNCLESGDRTTYVLTAQPKMNYDLENVIVLNHEESNLAEWYLKIIQLLVLKYEEVEKRPLKNLMVEGGAFTLAQFLKNKLAHYIEVSISPLILGGNSHRIHLGELLNSAPRYRFQSVQVFGVDVVASYSLLGDVNEKK